MGSYFKANNKIQGNCFNDEDNEFAYLACSLQHPTHLISITEPLIINLPCIKEVLQNHKMVFFGKHFFPIAQIDESVYKTTIKQCITEMSKKIVDFVKKKHDSDGFKAGEKNDRKIFIL